MGKIQIKRGQSANLPDEAAVAELLYTTDTNNLYIGNGTSNDLTKFLNEEEIESLLTSGYAALIHTHTASNITDFNTSVDARITAQKGVTSGLATLDSNGKIPTTQIPTIFRETSVVTNIAARDALEKFTGLHVLVADASSDSTVESGAAEYVYNGTTWLKIAELSTIDAIADWSNIQNKPTFVTSFTGLLDVPTTYTDCEGYLLAVNEEGTGLEFVSSDIDGGTF